MILSLSGLGANKGDLQVTAVAGPEAGHETFTFTVMGDTITTTAFFQPNELKQVTVKHNRPPGMELVSVTSSDQRLSAMLELTGNEDWHYPGTGGWTG
jgi:hypothetical protein